MNVRGTVLIALGLMAGCDRETDAPRDPEPPAPSVEPPTETPVEPAPVAKPKETAPRLSLALRAEPGVQLVSLTDGSLLAHGHGKLARIQDGKLVEVETSPLPMDTFELAIFHDQLGGRWPDAVFACWMQGLPNEPGRPILMRFSTDTGWRRVMNGRSKKQWCYEGFAQTASGSLVSRRIAHDFEEERFAISGQFIVDPRRPGFITIDGEAKLANPKMAFVTDWTLGEDDALWAVTGMELVQLSGPGAPRSFTLPGELGTPGSDKTVRVQFDEGTLYVYGGRSGSPVISRLEGDALEAVEPPPVGGRGTIAMLEATPGGTLWALTGRRNWAEIADGVLWHRRPDSPWVAVDVIDPKAVVPDSDSQWQYDDLQHVVTEGEHAWVSVRSSRYGGAQSVVLTTRSVDEVIDWRSSGTPVVRPSHG